MSLEFNFLKKISVAALLVGFSLIQLLPSSAAERESQADTAVLQLIDTLGNPLVGAVLFDTNPSSEEAQGVTHTMDQIQRQFVPSALTIQTGDSVTFPNSDSIRHHVFSFSSARSFDFELYGNSEAPTIDFPNAGYVVVGCNIHDDMIGHIIVSSSGHFYTSDSAGEMHLRELETYTGWYLWHPWMAAVGLAPIELSEIALNQPYRIAVQAPIERAESDLESRFRRRLQRGH